MEIVIDIPERVVTAIQNGEDYRYDIHTAIAQGIPYEPKGDLISREALKKEIIELNLDNTSHWSVIYKIDNAPTVSLQDIYQEGHYDGYLEGYTKAINEERKQGKPVIKCQDCKYRVKEWREDKRMKDKGYWVYGCEHFGEIMGYWGFGGNDNEFCSDAEQKGGAE